MIVEKQQLAMNHQQQQQRGRRSNGDYVASTDDDEDADNDEENIVIDMADEDYDDDAQSEAQYGLNGHLHQVSAFSSNKNPSTIIINNNDTNHSPLMKSDSGETSELSDGAAAETSHLLQRFAVGDPVWFDPKQLGYCVPGQVVDLYPELNMMTVEGHAQPSNGELGDEQLQVSGERELLQLYDLSDPQQFKSVRPRLATSSPRGSADLTQLEELSLESIIWNLRLRHKQQLVYTSCGPRILLSVNPLQQLPEVYNLEQVNRHDTLNSAQLARAESCPPLVRWLLLEDGRQQQAEQLQQPEDQEPHIFGLANEALKRLLIDQQDQCFVLLGESGSGKTEACKLLVQYLATVNKSPSNLMTEQILESIQLLESFGNAKTALNDNASRFGKLLEVRFQLTSGFITSARTIDLGLLDRTRIVSQAEGERNYHIFYELLAGLSRDEKEKYGLQSAERYFYLNQGHCVDLANKEDGDDFRALLASMQVLGFNYEEQDTVFRLLASVLHLGNVYFHRKVLAVRSGKLAAAAGELAGVEGVEIGSDTEVRWVSHLLQIQFDSVMRCLSVRTTEAAHGDPHQQQVHVERIVTPLNIDQALDTRDAIACTLYTCLFRWLMQRINAMISSQRDQAEEAAAGRREGNERSEPTYLCRTSESLCEFQPDKLESRASSLSRARRDRQSERRRSLAASATVNILDAFGFESLAENNFEQLCINYAAELMQYHTSRYLLRLEQAEYARERLRWTPIQVSLAANAAPAIQTAGNSGLASTVGDQSVINLLAKKPLGLLALLDDECNFPKATDQSFAEKCHHNHTLNENYQRARLASNSQEFGVRHFRLASRLTWYQVEGFVEKNRDTLRPDVAELLMGSKMVIVGDMLRKLHQQEPSHGSKTLSRTYDGRYVCMKPRARTLAARFQDNLQNNRVLEALSCSVSQAQPPANEQLAKPEPWFILCLKPNKARSPLQFDVAYLQEQVRCMGLRELAHLRKLGFPVRLRYSEFVRRYKCLVPQKFLETLASYEHLQATPSPNAKRAIREVCGALLDFRLGPEAARPLYQCGLTKMFLNERLYLRLERLRLLEHQRAVEVLQRTLRMWQVRSHYLLQRRAAVVIQSQVRGYLARRDFWRRYALVVAMQRRWRRLLVQKRRRELELRRRQQRLKQQHQLQEVQLQQRKQANQFRFRQPPGQVQASGHYATTRLDIPDELAQLYRIQRDYLPVHDHLTQLSDVDLDELAERELRRASKHQRDSLSVPHLAQDFQKDAELETEESRRVLQELEADERYSLHHFIGLYYPLEAPQFGYSRLPITRPFSWRKLIRRRTAALRRSRNDRQASAAGRRFEAVEMQAATIYKLLLRFIDSDLSTAESQQQPLLRFKLIADYIVHLCIAEPLLRDEVYLQLASQSWQNPRQKSTENVWRLMANCLSCFAPRDRRLTRFLLRYISEYCCESYHHLLVLRLVRALSDPPARKYPPSVLEYWANQGARARLALAVSYYMEEQGAPRQPEASLANYSGASVVRLDANTRAEQLAADALRSRHLPEANLRGWSVEVEHEGGGGELSSRLRGDDLLLDHLSRIELLPEFAQLIESAQAGAPAPCEPDRCRPAEEQRQPSPVCRESRARKLSLSEFSSNSLAHQHHQLQAQRNSTLSQRSSDTGGRRNSYMSASELCGYAPSGRMSQSGRQNRRYLREQRYPDSEQVDYGPLSPDPSVRRLHRRSMSMQELQLASSALNGRYFGGRQPQAAGGSSHYASSYVAPQQPPMTRHQGSLQQLARLDHQVAGTAERPGRRRSQTPNSMLNSQRMSSSAYGSESHRSYVTSSSELNERQSRLEGSLRRNQARGDGHGPQARRSASSSSRVPQARGLVDPTSDYTSNHSDYERLKAPLYEPVGGAQYLPGARLQPNHSQQRRPPPSRKRLAPRAPHDAELRGPRPPVGEPKVDYNSQSHYMASSAMSDTSEAPSLASHVRGVKVPQHNGDLDQYLDDLFQPMLDEAELDDLSDARSLATSIRGTTNEAEAGELANEVVEPAEPQQSARLSPTFETLLQSLRSNAELSIGAEEASPIMSRLGDMNLDELKALNERLEHQIQTAQQSHQRQAPLESSSQVSAPSEGSSQVPAPPPLPDFGAPIEDLYSRAKTVRIGKWRWPPASDEQQVPPDAEAQIINYFESRERKRLSQQSQGSDVPVERGGQDSAAPVTEGLASEEPSRPDLPPSAVDEDAKMMPPPPVPLAMGGSVGKLKISSEMKAKLEQLTTSSGGTGRDSAAPTGIVSQTKSLLLSQEGGEVPRLAEQRRKLLEKQLLGAQTSGDQAGGSNRSSVESSTGKVMAAKQQLAAAAGVALAALDGGSSQASSRRQSSAEGKRGSTSDELQRQSRVLHDELGPQSRTAISQRQAFYQMSASSDQIDNLEAGEPQQPAMQQVHGGSDLQLRPGPEFIPPPTAGSQSSDNLQQAGEGEGLAARQVGGKHPLTRAMQMSANLNEAGQSSALGQESERLYGQSIAKSLSQRQHESLLQAGKRDARQPAQADQWVASPEGSARRRAKRAGSDCERRPAKSAKKQQRRLGSNTALAYSNVPWQVRIRKEFFLPSETYDDPLVVQLIFGQLVADVFNPRHWTRLNHKERAAIKALMKDNSIGYAAHLPQMGQMQEVKRELVRMARSFGLYFTRAYPATNLALTAETLCQAGQWLAGRGSGAGSPDSPSGSSSDGEEAGEEPVSEQALRLLRRLRNADNLGEDWLDMVAVHHSGLRLVVLVPSERPDGPPDALGAPPTAGYKVTATLKYRDMTDVSQLGQSELLVSMRNGKKCWLISSKQATQLGALLRCFHADYNEHLQSSNNSNPKTARADASAPTLARGSLQKKQLTKTRANNDALLAPDDDHHGDHLAQRQASDGLGKLRPAAHPNDDLANPQRVLPNHLAASGAPSEPQPAAHNASTGGARAPTRKLRPTGVALDDDDDDSEQFKEADNSNQQQQNSKQLPSSKKNLWQNSLSRMSNKFSIFGSQSRATGASCEPQVTQQLALDAWIEAKVDFDEDDEAEPSPAADQRPQASDEQQVAAEDEPHRFAAENQSTSEMGSLRSKRSQRIHPDGQSAQPPVEADGKHSLLQFALYNFREAIDKYSLESRASKAQLAPGDTSTLRGSLKLIETLRSARSSDSGHGSSSAKSERKSRAQATLNGSGADWTWRELAEMVKFTPVPIRSSLLKLPSEDLNKRALDCFQALMQYMGDAPRAGSGKSGSPLQQADEVDCVYLIMMNCHKFPLLRDEVYCQLMKQTTSNRSGQPDSCLRGWRLFSIMAAYFDSSDAFRPYLLKYLETAAYDKRRAYCSVAALCLQNLRKTLKYGGRKNVPSIEEIAATSAGRNSKRQIYRLPGGTERVINTKSTTVVDDIIHEICANMLNVVEAQEMLEFSLYCIADGDLYTMPLNRDEYILDITTELIKNHQQYFLIFCRSIWHYPLRLDSKLYIEVIFNQIAPDYLEGLLLVLPHLSVRSGSRKYQQSEGSADSSLRLATPLRLKSKLVREVARIAALLHRASGTDYMPAKDEVKYLLPKPIISAMKQQQRALAAAEAAGSVPPTGASSLLSQSERQQSDSPERDSAGADQSATMLATPQRWIELVQSNWRDMSAFDTLDAKAQFLDIVRHWPLFGSSFFAIKLIQRDLIQPLDFILALNKLGIQMLDTATHETVHRYPFNEVISTRKVRSEDGALFLDLKCGNLMKRTIIRIQTDQAHEISRLIRQYIDIELLQQKQLQTNSMATSQQLSMPCT